MKSGKKQNKTKATRNPEIRVRLPCSDSACQHLGVLCKAILSFLTPDFSKALKIISTKPSDFVLLNIASFF